MRIHLFQRDDFHPAGAFIGNECFIVSAIAEDGVAFVVGRVEFLQKLLIVLRRQSGFYGFKKPGQKSAFALAKIRISIGPVLLCGIFHVNSLTSFNLRKCITTPLKYDEAEGADLNKI